MADKRELLFSFIGKETVSPAAKRAGDAVDKLGNEFKATSLDAKKLDHEIETAQKSLRELAVQFARTEDAAERMDLSKQMRKQQSELRKLSKAKGLLPDFDEEGKKGAASFAASFGRNVGGLLGQAPLAPAIAAMAPTLAAGLAGAVVGGAAAGGIVGGVLLAARDPRVQDAGSKLGEFVLGDLEMRASGFVPEVLKGIGRIQSAWVGMGPDLDRIFSSSRMLEPLLDGLLSGGKKFIHGIADAVDNADPVVEAFGRSFDAIGESVGNLFTSMSGDAKEGASAIDDLTGSIVNLMDTVTLLAHYGAEIKGASDNLDVLLDKGRYWIEDNSAVAEALGHLGIKLDLTADGFKAGSVEAEAYRKATLGTAEVVDFAVLKHAGMTDAQIAAADASGTYRQKLDEVKSATEGGTGAIQNQTAALSDLADKLRAQTDPTFALIDAQHGLRDAQKEYNDAVKEHGKKSPEAQAALLKSAEAAIALQGAVGGAAGTFNGKLSPAMVATLKAAHFTDAQIAALEGQFKTAQAAGAGFAKNYQATAGLTDMATAKARAIRTEISKIQGKTVVINIKMETHGSVQGEHIIGQGTQVRASGGPVAANRPYLVGEEGPELITPTKSGFVHDAAKTASLMAGARGVGGGASSSGPMTGQPTEITLTNIVNLDSQKLYSYTDKVVATAQKRQEFRTSVGRR